MKTSLFLLLCCAAMQAFAQAYLFAAKLSDRMGQHSATRSPRR